MQRRPILHRSLAAVLAVGLTASAALAYQAHRLQMLVSELSRIHDGFVPVSRGIDDLRREVRAVGRSLAVDDLDVLRRMLRANQDHAAAFQRMDRALIDLASQIEALAAPEPAGGPDHDFLSNLGRSNEDLRVEVRRLQEKVSDLSAELEGGTQAVEGAQRQAERRAARLETRFERLAAVVDMYTDRAFEGARASEAEAARLSVIAVAVTTLIAFGALVFVSRSLSSVRQLQSAAERLRAGDYRAAELPITDDEIGDLAREFEAMARAIGARDTRLRAQFEELEAAHRAIGVEHAARLRAERLAAAGELAGRITHEVRNPLSSISLNAEMLSEALSGVAAPDEAREALRIIGREVARLDALTEDYLGLARTARPESEWVPLSDLVAELAGSLRLEAARSGARIEIDNQLAHPAVTVPGTIRQALMNLARNALQFVTDRDVAVVRLTLQSSDHSVDIHVDDSGPGIPADDLDRIFEAFFSRRAGGTGLGLAISRRIVELEGGRLGATPTGPLGGARFSVALPSRA